MPHGINRHTHKYPGSARNTVVSKPAQEKYYLLDAEVDRDTYEKYASRKYNLGNGDTASLAMVSAFAHGKELAEAYPEKSAAAQQILAQIISEITGKEDENMKDHRTAAGFLDSLKDIYNEARKNYDSIQNKVELAEAKMIKAREKTKDPKANSNIARVEYEIAKGEYTLAQTDVRNEYNDMLHAYEEKIKDLRKSFEEYLSDHYAASPDKLDSATMQLLNTGICTPSDLGRLSERHKDNPTMLRIIGEYARNMRENKRKNMSSDDLRICNAVVGAGTAAKDGARELALFDSAASAADYGLGKDYAHATNMNKHVPGWMDNFRGQMADLCGSAE